MDKLYWYLIGFAVFVVIASFFIGYLAGHQRGVWFCTENIGKAGYIKLNITGLL
jgi:hypothetical protein